MVVHSDKLKPCFGETPRNWMEANEEPGEDRDEIHAQRKRSPTTRQPTQMDGGTTTINTGEDQESEESPRINKRRRPQRPRKYDDYICHYSLIAGVAMPRITGRTFQCRACNPSFHQCRYMMRHLRDAAARQRHDSFFADPLNRQQLLSEARLDWYVISSQAPIDRTSEKRSLTSRVNIVGARTPTTGRSWFLGAEGRRQLETLAQSVLVDPDCKDVTIAVEELLQVRPDLTDGEA